MTESEQDFEDILLQVQCGSQEALVSLVEHYQEDIRIIARAQLGPALRPYMDSLDLVQSVHHSLIAGLRANKYKFSSPDKLIALASVVLRRKVARHWRKLRRQQRESGIRPSDVEMPDFVVSLSNERRNPAEIVSFRDQVAFVMDRLDGVDRELVALRLDGYSTVEAARHLGIDSDVARVRLSRLRRRLKNAQILARMI